MQEAAEEYIIQLFQDAMLCAIHARRVTVSASTSGQKQRKPHRFKPSTMALREIRHFHKTSKLLIPAAPFIRTVREISFSLAPTITRWQAEALVAIQEAAEEYIVQHFQNAMLCAIHARRVTVTLLHPAVVSKIVEEDLARLCFFVSMASKTNPNASLLPWIWAVEALASNCMDASVLIDLVKKIPVVLSESDGKSARELACSRISESLSVLEKGKSSDVLHKFDSGVGFSPSDCCQDVLGQLLSEEKFTETTMLKADLKQPLVQHKRYNLPKCGLKEAAILKDNNLLQSSLIERSGLLIKNNSDGITTRREGSNCDALENPPVKGLSSGKTIMNDSATANQEESSSGKQLIVYNAYPNFNAAMKHKHEALSMHKTVEGKDSASFHKRSDVEDISEEPQVEYLRETISSENVASKKLKTSSTVADAGLLNNQVQATCNVAEVARDTSGEEHISNIISHEAEKDGEDTVKLRTSSSSVQLATQETRSVDGAKGNCERNYLLTPNNVCSGEAIPSKELDHLAGKSSNDDTHNSENDDIIIRKDTFSNSQYSHSQDSLATVNGTTQLCMICRIGGQLLVCSSGSCRRVDHERCMGVAPTFVAIKNFLCPFCGYSHAISEYSESKKKASLARKALLPFISRDEYRLRSVSPILHRADQGYLGDSEVSDKHDEQKSLGDGVSRDNESQSKIQKHTYPSIPQLRRKKVPWSNAEEETLMEGVRRFASSHNKVMPWKKILEFGADIFEKKRTTVDLKDKWRNIRKGSSKSKV